MEKRVLGYVCKVLTPLLDMGILFFNLKMDPINTVYPDPSPCTWHLVRDDSAFGTALGPVG